MWGKAFVVAAALFAALAVAQDDTVVIPTQYGDVRGLVTSPSHRSFFGIPHSAPPVGSLRWAKPQPPASWSPAVRDATSETTADCFQSAGGLWFTQQSEDCLYMNVWTPADATNTSALPVLVFFYGGGMETGGIALPVYDGAGLVKMHGDVVVVTVNYRINVFGFLGGQELAQESRDGSNGNYGLLDQRNALIWVRDNIVQFGGDPSSVTIFGESAGAYCVNDHMTMPGSYGLFHAAIMESGTNEGQGFLGTFLFDQTYGNAQYNDVLATFNCTDLACLRAIPGEDIIALGAIDQLGYWGAIVDGVELPADPRDMVRTGDFYHVPIILGTNSDEVPGFLRPGATQAQYTASLVDLFGPQHGMALVEVYPLSDYEDNAFLATQAIMTDDVFTCPTRRSARYFSQYIDVYAYWFSYVHSAVNLVVPFFGAFHASELPYVFNFEPILFTTGDHTMAETTSTYWTNFARTGNPNSGLPVGYTWPQFTPSSQLYLDQNVAPAIISSMKPVQCDVHDEIDAASTATEVAERRKRVEAFWNAPNDLLDRLGADKSTKAQ